MREQHTSPLIRQCVVRRGTGKGQVVTYCLADSHDAGSEGFLVSIDIALLARLAADLHLAEHERDKALTP
jgi:hypothetical protein